MGSRPAVRSWLGAALSPSGPWGVGISYGVLLVVLDVVVSGRADGGASVRGWWSTNVDNLTGGAPHAGAALVGSAFVVEESVGWWALFAVVALVVAGRRVGWWQLTALVAAVHVAATLVSELVWAGTLPDGAAGAAGRAVVDVGPSYVVVAALTVGILYGRRWERVPAVVVFALLAPYLFTGLGDLEVSAVGHTCSIVLAAAGGAVLVRRARREPVPA